jgi:DNA-binding Lrp family transcriptional regulator
MPGMDDLDRSIVRLLERHGRLSQEELAAATGRSWTGPRSACP